MTRVRRLTPTEWLYRCLEPELPPFAIQLWIALAPLPDVEALEHALAACAQANPAARLQPRGRWWHDEGGVARVVRIDEASAFSLQHPALARPLPAAGPPIEVLWWPGTGLLLRCTHALMDAAGLLHFAQDLFRALRGEPLLGSRGDVDDWSVLKASPHRRPLRALRPSWRSPAGDPVVGASPGHVHALRQVRGRVDSPAARVAAALAQAGGACRVMMPVDLRLADASLRTTANLSNPLILDIEPHWDATACWRHVLAALGRHEQYGMAAASAALPWLAARATGRALGAVQRWQVRHGRHLFSALSSHLARTSLAAFAFDGQAPSRVGFLPFDTPGAGLNVLTLQHDDALELAASCPAAAGSHGRLERLLDVMCAELERGVVAPAPARAPARAGPAIAIAATFVAEPLASVLSSWLRAFGLPHVPTFAPYGQVMQSLADPAALFAANRDGVNVVLLRLEDWWRPAAGDPGALRANVDDLVAALARAAARGEAPLVAWLAPLSRRVRDDAVLVPLQASLSERLAVIPGLRRLDDDVVRRWYPVAEDEAPVAEAVGHVPYGRDRYAALASALARTVVDAVVPPLKVIVVDADNTLWRGVCAELGPQGVEVTPGHRALQAWLVAQVEAGRLVCLASRNEPADVEAVFAHNAGMLLRPGHLVARRVDWGRKSDNVRALAGGLGLGLDSVVFIDDNPVECAQVAAHCPGVQVLRLPDDDADIPAWLAHLWALEPVAGTAAPARTRLYRQEDERAALRAQSGDFQAFLDALRLQVDIAPPAGDECERVAELSRRTNQFNLAPRTRTAAHFQALGARCLAVHVADRFGDYGLTGALTWRAEARALRIDAWMLSCRVLGRGVEHRVLAALGELAGRLDCDELVFDFEPTPRNAPARSFLASACERVSWPDGERFRIDASQARALRQPVAPAADPAPDVGLPSRGAGLPAGVLDLVARERRDVAAIRAAAGEGAAAVAGDDLPASLAALARSVSGGTLALADPDDSLVELGLDSLQIVTLLDEAARTWCPGRDGAVFDAGLGRFLDHPTLRELASMLRRLAQEPPP